MTESEAIRIVKDQLTSEHGFVARVRNGEGVDQAGLARFYSACDALATSWGAGTEVPKAGVLPMVGVGAALWEAAPQYKDASSEIHLLSSEVLTRCEQTVHGPERMTEEEAMALVYGHATGLASLALNLHHRERPNFETLEELSGALETLVHAWGPRERVPRRIAGAMLDIGGLVRGHAGWWPDIEQRLMASGAHLDELARKCFE